MSFDTLPPGLTSPSVTSCRREGLFRCGFEELAELFFAVEDELFAIEKECRRPGDA